MSAWWGTFDRQTAAQDNRQQSRACNCMGPQNGDPVCPCAMPAYREREATKRALQSLTTGHGCICPPTSELTCKGPLCPRRPIGAATC